MISELLQLGDVVLSLTELIDGASAVFTGVMAYVVLKTYRKQFPSQVVSQINTIKDDIEAIKAEMTDHKSEDNSRFADGNVRFVKIDGKLDVIASNVRNIGKTMDTIQADIREIREGKA